MQVENAPALPLGLWQYSFGRGATPQRKAQLAKAKPFLDDNCHHADGWWEMGNDLPDGSTQASKPFTKTVRPAGGIVTGTSRP
jgi:hypothetical protein